MFFLKREFSVIHLESLLKLNNSYFQLEILKHYLNKGGNVLIMLGEGGELKYDTNINYLLEGYGIMVNSGVLVTLKALKTPIQLLPYSFPIPCGFFHHRCRREEGLLQIFPSQRGTGVQWRTQQVGLGFTLIIFA